MKCKNKSNWKLDAAKMNRVVLHRAVEPDEVELVKTADAIMKERWEGSEEDALQQQVLDFVPKIASLFQELVSEDTPSPFSFSFYGCRDFYSLVSYLIFIIQKSRRVSSQLLEGVLRNFGGLTKQQTETFLFPKISKHLKIPTTSEFSSLHLIRNNIEQIKEPNSPCMRNIMLITEFPTMWKILLDSGIATMDSTDVIFGSRFLEDQRSNMYLHQTIEHVRNSMKNGRLCILLQLDQLYDSLYDVLNQRYETIDNQMLNIEDRKGGFFLKKQQLHINAKDAKLHTPVAFLSRFEKFLLDPDLLEKSSLDKSWKPKWDKLQEMIKENFSDGGKLKDIPFVGFERYTYISLLLNENTSKKMEPVAGSISDLNIQQSCENCIHMLYQNTNLEYFINNRRQKTNFVPYADIVKDFFFFPNKKNQCRLVEQTKTQ
ncbi:ring finger protein [Reticulomyxa filosa]|uniref:Ring finger protein n=1 Tax=Reticulomyxa filosa TaxID=46433 RepID=X6NAP3_RETFI|nr:ring finger protein [Reticulomyxa filosa]|eukprot:ETO22963.1 ring finger protein [Reticulomyxa filosa]